MLRLIGLLLMLLALAASATPASVQVQTVTLACKYLDMPGGSRTSLVIDYTARMVTYSGTLSSASISSTMIRWSQTNAPIRLDFRLDRVTGEMYMDTIGLRDGRFLGTAHFLCELAQRRF
jgi:hypothetical protein